MSGKRILASVLTTLVLAGAAQAQSYQLTESPLAGAYFHVELAMTLNGDIKVQQEGKALTLKQAATARHDYVERILEAGKVLGDKSARIYQAAVSDITTDKEKSSRIFREGRRFIVAQRMKDQTISYCPFGTLTREELELTDHFDTLALPGLLPNREVKIGDTWKVTNAAAQTLLDLDGLVGQELTCKLEKVINSVAHVSVTGAAAGIDLGASVKLKVTGAYEFDLTSHRITALEWKQNDLREPGPASPGFQAEAVTRVKRTPVDAVPELNDFALVKIPGGKEPPEKLMLLYYPDPQGRYELVHGRDWHLVSRFRQQAVFRLMNRGDFVAQLTATAYRKTTPGQHLSPEDFRQAITQAPGWEPENVEPGAVVPAPNGNWIYRIGTSGMLNGIKVAQYFYLVAGPQGDQVVLTFTMAPGQVQALGSRDLELVRSLTLPAARKDNAVSTTP